MRVSGFHEILRGLGALSFKVFTGLHKVLQGFHTGSTRLHNVPPRVPEMFCKFRGLSWREAVCRAPVV